MEPRIASGDRCVGPRGPNRRGADLLSVNDVDLKPPIDADQLLLAASRSPLAARMAEGLERTGVIGASMLVAVSGGPDSTALFLLARALKERRRPPGVGRLALGHVDHGLRAESVEEARKVGELALATGTPFEHRRLTWPEGASISSEDARDARWRALHEMALEQGATVILAGHHADDQAETALLRLARGTGLAGLAGIPETRTIDDRVTIVRPLLDVRRVEIESFIRGCGVSVVDDPSNRRMDRARGRVRGEVLPALEAIHPGAGGRIAATAREAIEFRAGSPTPSSSVPPPSLVRWLRAGLTNGDERMVAGRIRTMVASTPGVDRRRVDAVARTFWKSVAVAVLDCERSPRTFGVPGVGTLQVRAEEIDFHPGSASLGSSGSLGCGNDHAP
ncbi:MAG: tRNA lysidine(34) synthetase TilS [Phycisphaerae bacterium]|nr:tRNA lysidine(34) synthetase TilS [Phycisphaerae bacterium]